MPGVFPGTPVPTGQPGALQTSGIPGSGLVLGGAIPGTIPGAIPGTIPGIPVGLPGQQLVFVPGAVPPASPFVNPFTLQSLMRYMMPMKSNTTPTSKPKKKESKKKTETTPKPSGATTTPIEILSPTQAVPPASSASKKSTTSSTPKSAPTKASTAATTSKKYIKPRKTSALPGTSVMKITPVNSSGNSAKDSGITASALLKDNPQAADSVSGKRPRQDELEASGKKRRKTSTL